MVVTLTARPDASVIIIGHTRGKSAEQVAARIRDEIASLFPKKTEITSIGLECRQKAAQKHLAWDYLDVRVGPAGATTRKTLTDPSEKKTGVGTSTILKWLQTIVR